jgi:hypothetical protein
MGLADRDYMAKREVHDFRPPPSSGIHWLWIAPLAILVLLVAVEPPGWTPPSIAAQIHTLRHRLGISQEQARSIRLPVAESREVVTPGGAPGLQAPPQPPTDYVIRRCMVNGVVIEIVKGRCPPSAPSAQTPSPAPQVSRGPEVRESPFFTPGKIYRCKSYSGAVFWAQSHCSQHSALIDRIASVPVGMPFQQQVDIAAAESRKVEAQLSAEQREGSRRATCQNLRLERERIWKRSGSGAGYVPLDVLGADQTRWREINSQLAQHNCDR